MISKNNVGRSSTGLVKIWSKYPSSSRSTRIPSSASSSHVLLNRTHTVRQQVVIRGRNLEERDIVGGHGLDALDDIMRGQGDVLHARPAVKIEEFLDLRPACDPWPAR